MNLYESALRAKVPWRDANVRSDYHFDNLPQQDIDICLTCPLHADSCDICDGRRNLTSGKRGREKREVDYKLLREMMRLKKCNREMCNALGVSKSTLARIKRELC